MSISSVFLISLMVSSLSSFVNKNGDDRIIVGPFYVNFYTEEGVPGISNPVFYTSIRFESSGTVYPYMVANPSDIYYEGTSIKKYEFNGWMTSDYEIFELGYNTVSGPLNLYARWKFVPTTNFCLFNFNYESEVNNHSLKKLICENYDAYDIELNSINGMPDSHFLSDNLSNINQRVQTGTYFNDGELADATHEAGHTSWDYPGCGPIAQIGVMDYLYRYMGFDDLFDGDITSLTNRKNAVGSLIEADNCFPLLNGIATSPSYFANGFNEVASDYGYSVNELYCTRHIYEEPRSDDISTIKISINFDVPVTIGNVFVAILLNPLKDYETDFLNHYFNVFGYETYNWYDYDYNEVTKTFFYVHLNLGNDEKGFGVLSEDYFTTEYTSTDYYTYSI